MVKAMVYGRLTQDPVRREAGSNFVTELNIAVDTSFKKDEKLTNYYRASVWNKRGETCATYLHKGDAVLVVGDLTAREYTKKDGTMGYSLELGNCDVQFGQRSKNSEAAYSSAPAPAPEPNAPTTVMEDPEDSLPF